MITLITIIVVGILLMMFFSWSFSTLLPFLVIWILLANLPSLLKGVSLFAKMDESIKSKRILRFAWLAGTCFVTSVVIKYLPF